MDAVRTKGLKYAGVIQATLTRGSSMRSFTVFRRSDVTGGVVTVIGDTGSPLSLIHI